MTTGKPSKQVNDNNPSKQEWFVQTLRLTAFTNTKFDTTSWWEAFAGEKPDSRQELPKQQITEYSGAFLGEKLTLQVSPGRIDWSLTDGFVLNEDNQITLLTKKLDDILPPFKLSCAKWLENDIPITRLAFGAILHSHVKDKNDGYRIISSFLPFDVDGVTCSDFNYSINRWRKTTTDIKDLIINRLSRWTVSKLVVHAITTVAGNPTPQTIPVNTEKYTCRLELDINTSQNLALELPHSDIVKLFEELVSLSIEISLNGDQP